MIKNLYFYDIIGIYISHQIWPVFPSENVCKIVLLYNFYFVFLIHLIA